MSQPTLVSPGLRAVLGQVPPWYERWGTTLVAGLVAGLLSLAGLVQYPDVLAVSVTVTAAPTGLVARAILPAANAHQVHVGQQVLLQVAGYPAGQLGTVAALAPATAAGYYQLIIKLSVSWIPPPSPPGTARPLTGTARIITRNTSLLDHIFGPMRQLLAARF